MKNYYLEFRNIYDIKDIIKHIESLGYIDGVGPNAILPAVVERYILCRGNKYYLCGFEPNHPKEEYIKCDNLEIFYNKLTNN